MCNRNIYESRRGIFINDDYIMKSVKCGIIINFRFFLDEFLLNLIFGSFISYLEVRMIKLIL